MKRFGRDPSIEHEPHLQNRAYELDPSERRADGRLDSEPNPFRLEDAVEHTVWDEPALSSELAGHCDDNQVTYARWVNQRQAETSSTKSWLVTLAVAIVAGPWGVIGALSGITSGGFALAMIIVIGPVTEEIMKVAAALWVVEKRPYLFKSVWQILLCAVAGGAAFAFIENLLYLYVYLPQHTSKLAAWRWTVCVGLHMNCSFVAGVGIARIWDKAIRNGHRPQLWLGRPWLFMAMVAHGMYNGATLVAETMGWLEL